MSLLNIWDELAVCYVRFIEWIERIFKLLDSHKRQGDKKWRRYFVGGLDPKGGQGTYLRGAIGTGHCMHLSQYQCIKILR